MPSAEAREPEGGMGLERLVFFSDAVFAIAITLLVLEIRLPELEPERVAAELPIALKALIPSISAFILSFVVIGAYWMTHHRLFRFIQAYDARLMWINLVFLMSIAFVPVPTAILGRYADYTTVTIIYAVSLGVVGLLEAALWAYASYHHRLINSQLSDRFIRYILLRTLVPSLIFFTSIPVALADANIGKEFWLIMIPAFILLRLLYSANHSAQSNNSITE
jgi:uncharacterized membrane protein